jgi:hypothetical protein
VPDEFSGDRVIGDFVGADRVDAGGGESGVEALSYSPSEWEVDEVVPGEVGECDFSPICQRVAGFADEDHGLAHELPQSYQLGPGGGDRHEGQVHLAVGDSGQMPG